MMALFIIEHNFNASEESLTKEYTDSPGRLLEF